VGADVLKVILLVVLALIVLRFVVGAVRSRSGGVSRRSGGDEPPRRP
jgi:hypothetical protein